MKWTRRTTETIKVTWRDIPLHTWFLGSLTETGEFLYFKVGETSIVRFIGEDTPWFGTALNAHRRIYKYKPLKNVEILFDLISSEGEKGEREEKGED